jgi:hypothetical protein
MQVMFNISVSQILFGLFLLIFSGTIVHADHESVIDASERRFIETYKALTLGYSTPESDLIRSALTKDQDPGESVATVAWQIEQTNASLISRFFPARCRSDEAQLEKPPLSIRPQYLARLNIEKFVGAQLVTKTYADDTGSNPCKYFVFDRPLTVQQKFAVIDLIDKYSQTPFGPDWQKGFDLFRPLVRSLQKELIAQFLPKFIELPPVTAGDIETLRANGPQHDARFKTSIVPMQAFMAAETETPIGLYKAVTGTYPHIVRKVPGFEHANFPVAIYYTEEQVAAIYKEWDADPYLPLAHTTAQADSDFVEALSAITGRKISITSPSQNEYARRGRGLDARERPLGPITATQYYFGDAEADVTKRAFVKTNSGGKAHAVNEPLPNQSLDDSRNSFGLLHTVGNMQERSFTKNTDGEIEHVPDLRGGSYLYRVGLQRSAYFVTARNLGKADIGSRLVETPGD